MKKEPTVYELVLKFKKKYPMSLAWRLRKNAKIVEMHINPDEKPLYAFAAQKNNNPFDFIKFETTYSVPIINSCIYCLFKLLSAIFTIF